MHQKKSISELNRGEQERAPGFVKSHNAHIMIRIPDDDLRQIQEAVESTPGASFKPIHHKMFEFTNPRGKTYRVEHWQSGYWVDGDWWYIKSWRELLSNKGIIVPKP